VECYLPQSSRTAEYSWTPGFAQKYRERIGARIISHAKAQRRKGKPPTTRQRFASLRLCARNILGKKHSRRILFQSGLDRRLHAFVRVIGKALAVNVECGRTVDAELPPVDDVALDLLGKFAAVERGIEAASR